MGIRKYLCRKLDREGKGYITVEDITDKVFSGEFAVMTMLISMTVICLTLLICLIGEVYNYGDTRSGAGEPIFMLVNLNNFVAGFAIVGSLIVIALILTIFWGYIKTFKVVVCPLKQKEEKKD